MSQEDKEPINHVIFLGAGASYNSGYPVGDSLRLRMACRNHFEEELKKSFGDKNTHDTDFSTVGHVPFDRYHESIALFRRGGFGTVDEFSKLASEDAPEHVQIMKRFMPVALSLHDPEKHFHKSDYYPFIQRLFEENLFDLKHNITVISFNYDCYLDFLLLTAFQERQKLTKSGRELKTSYKNKITSGFWSKSDNFDWAGTTGFNYYKLHGSIAFGDDDQLGYDALFRGSIKDRMQLFDSGFLRVPPIVFPWELFDEKGEFIAEKDFVFVRNDKTGEGEGTRLFNHFKAIWQGAKVKVDRAQKFSFVGLSMHSYLEKGFEYLFNGNCNAVQVVVANTDNEKYQGEKAKLHPLSPCGKVSSLLSRRAPNLKCIPSDSETDGTIHFKGMDNEGYEPDMTARYSFRDFIEKEMD